MRTKPKKRKPFVPGGNSTWNNDSTLASYPGPGYTRKLSYDEEGRLTKIDRDNGTTITPVFEYGYGFDGNRRWRKDLAGNTWDWYPCGVACCAGELVTLRSANGGSTWSQLESRLDSTPVVDGQPFLDSLGSGTKQIGSELAIRDSLGVTRSGIVGTKLNSTLNYYRDDEAIDQTTSKLGQRQRPVQLDCEKKLELKLAIIAAEKERCLGQCNLIAGGCGVVCGAVCAGSLGLGCGVCIGACLTAASRCVSKCVDKNKNDIVYAYKSYADCKSKEKPKPKQAAHEAKE